MITIQQISNHFQQNSNHFPKFLKKSLNQLRKKNFIVLLAEIFDQLRVGLDNRRGLVICF